MIILSCFLLLIGFQSSGANKCDDYQGLENGDPFYNFTSAVVTGNVSRLLRGSLSVVRMQPGQPLAFTISGKRQGSDFSLSKLCVWSANASYFLITYEGQFNAPMRSVDSEGRITIQATGPPLSVERVGELQTDDFDLQFILTKINGEYKYTCRIRLGRPDQWTKVCANGTGVYTRVRVQAYGYQETSILAKALHMHACPRRRKAPHATCSLRQDLVAGQSYYNVTSSHGDATRALLGTKQALRAPEGKSLYLTITAASMVNISGLDVTMLCLWTLNANSIVTVYHGVAPEPVTVFDASGNVIGQSRTGPGLSNEKNRVRTPHVWTQTCLRHLALHTQIDVTIQGASLSSRVMAKGLVMHACPWSRKTT